MTAKHVCELPPLTLALFNICCCRTKLGIDKVCRELCDAVRVTDLEEMKHISTENDAEVVQAWLSKDDNGFKAMTAR